MLVTLSCVLLQIAVPPPRGYVNDFAGVLDSTSIAHMDAVIAKVSDKTRGEIAAVTLPHVTVPNPGLHAVVQDVDDHAQIIVVRHG